MKQAPLSQNNALSITTTDLSKRYNREWIFRRFTHRFTAGNTYAITGPNGSGKSTLLQVLWGQIPPTSGELTFRVGETPIPIEEAFKYLSIATPYMDLIDEFTLTEMLRFHFRLKKVRKDIDRNELLARMYLEDAADKQLINFSSGMRQRLKLALAFYTEADICFLDEPGTNLDKRAFEWYGKELRQLPPRTMAFIASNNPDEYPETASVINILDYKR